MEYPQNLTVSERRWFDLIRQCRTSGKSDAQWKGWYRPIQWPSTNPMLYNCNESKVQNIVNREFSNQPQYNAVVSDLTYVRVGNSWNYICVLIDLFNREIIGYSAGKNKDAILVSKAFSRVDINLNKIQIFHIDHGSEFKNRFLDETLEAFQIRRFLSMKRCSYDMPWRRSRLKSSRPNL